MTDIVKQLPELADRIEGPPVIAFWGSERPGDGSAIQLREFGWHGHARGQLFSVESGLVRIRTHDGSWLLPPRRIGWVPAGELHEVSISGSLSGWGAMISPAASSGLPERVCVMAANDLLRSLVHKAMGFAEAEVLSPEQERLTAVLLDEIRAAPLEPLHLPMPSDARLLRLTMHLLAQPGEERPFAQLVSELGMSERTARRCFQAETGMTFQQWRQQARLSLAFELLAQGQQVGAVSDALGYATPSNFIAMFRRAFGCSPTRYFGMIG
ncbi:AraC family transcriptional regulator [Novosphingobium sp. PhB57]|uniref:AraC family transcriptional regulator n=1 Tax=Novosphingobium sp. PhB57 TaxID=2485107 RepID=UPI00104B778A|nr:helix-turn-helix transcriptional regulator [Novosphingobium sp. PhB57]TCU57788.1 AraC family transcriptional regulator [Novosphingobium sp. PhB57]